MPDKQKGAHIQLQSIHVEQLIRILKTLSISVDWASVLNLELVQVQMSCLQSVAAVSNVVIFNSQHLHGLFISV